LSEAEQAPGAQLGLLISRYTGTSPQFWINLQGQYDLEIIGSALSKKLAAINPVTMISEALKRRGRKVLDLRSQAKEENRPTGCFGKIEAASGAARGIVPRCAQNR
jgi:hypothetical protein